MATTTNYGWTTPDDTALVKDGAAAIRTLGSSVDTTTKNLNPSTTLGDIEYRSSTANVNTRLPLGTAGQVLKVNSGATAPEWATDASGMTNPMTTTGDTIYSSSGSTPARLGIGSTGQVLTVAAGIPSWSTPAVSASGLTKILANTFTNVASVTIDSVFSSTYKRYVAYISALCVDPADYGADLQLQYRYGSTTAAGSDYYGAGMRQSRTNAITNFGFAATTSAIINDNQDGSLSHFEIHFDQVGNSSIQANHYGIAHISSSQSFGFFTGLGNDVQTYTGFLLKQSAGNITGSYAVYGYQN